MHRMPHVRHASMLGVDSTAGHADTGVVLHREVVLWWIYINLSVEQIMVLYLVDSRFKRSS